MSTYFDLFICLSSTYPKSEDWLATHEDSNLSIAGEDGMLAVCNFKRWPTPAMERLETGVCALTPLRLLQHLDESTSTYLRRIQRLDKSTSTYSRLILLLISRLRLIFVLTSTTSEVDFDLFASLMSVPPQGAAVNAKCRLIPTYSTYSCVSVRLIPESGFQPFYRGGGWYVRCM